MTNTPENTQKRLFLLDAYALIFRGYYALIKNPRVNSKGMDTSAIMGFMNSLFDVIKREKPDHLAVAFDKGGSSDRVEMYEDYKANRDETPDAIKIAVPYIQSILKAMHVPCIEIEGVEADDLIGTLSKQAEKEGYQVFMVTPDKDYAQLVSENIFMYKPARMGNGIEIWGIPEVQKKFEVERPEQVIDYLGMMGDASDNIPGLPGVGDKTAKKFIKQYGGLEGLLENTDKLKGKMYQAEKERSTLSKTTLNLTDYLRSLNIIIYIKEANKNTIPRISQLTQKTNQFNLTTKRYKEEDIIKFSKSNDFLVISIRLVDKFGDSGLTGVAVIDKKSTNKWRIDTFLLSCRILGRKAEEVLLAYIIKEAKMKGVRYVYGHYIDSLKNAPAKNFYGDNGFKKIDSSDEMEVWKYDTKKEYSYPDFINYKIS